MAYDGAKASTPDEICKLFSDFFRKVYIADDSASAVQPFGIDKITDVREYELTIKEVRQALRSIDTSKGPVPDGISPLLLKRCANVLFSPLQRLYNLSLSTYTFPEQWKHSELVPSHKSGSRNDISNYRVIAILPTVGKLFESIICTRLTADLSQAISNAQHGFRKRRSTSTNLITFTNYALKVIESGSQIDAIYTDIRKAFDRVKHRYLLQKLREMGIRPGMLGWIKSYLINRSQCVRVLGWKSASFTVPSGLPQRPPLLFILFINDATKIFRFAGLGVFADDLKLYAKVDSETDALQLQDDVNLFHAWCSNNGMELNIEKFKTMSFHRKSTPILFSYTI